MGLAKTGIHEAAAIKEQMKATDRSLSQYLSKLVFCVQSNKPASYVYSMVKSYGMESIIEQVSPEVYAHIKSEMPKKAAPKVEATVQEEPKQEAKEEPKQEAKKPKLKG